MCYGPECSKVAVKNGLCDGHNAQRHTRGQELRPLRPLGKRGSGTILGGYRLIQEDGRRTGEHRWVMERILGRRLLRSETVHHKNGDRTDNRPENLELWSSSQPPGQRVSDKLAWAREIIALYGEVIECG